MIKYHNCHGAPLRLCITYVKLHVLLPALPVAIWLGQEFFWTTFGLHTATAKTKLLCYAGEMVQSILSRCVSYKSNTKQSTSMYYTDTLKEMKTQTLCTSFAARYCRQQLLPRRLRRVDFFVWFFQIV